jgi:hypothetical protein
LGHNHAPRSADGNAPRFLRPTFSNGCSVDCDRGGNSMVNAKRRPRSPRGATVNTAGVGISNRVEGASGAAAPEGCPPTTTTEAGSLESSEGPQDSRLRGRFFVAGYCGRGFVFAPSLAAGYPRRSGSAALRWPVPPAAAQCHTSLSPSSPTGGVARNRNRDELLRTSHP